MSAGTQRGFLIVIFVLLVLGLSSFGVYYFAFKPINLEETQKAIYQLRKISSDGRVVSVGSAFKISPTRYLTAAHVISLYEDALELQNNYKYILIDYYGEKQTITKIFAFDEKADIAVFEAGLFKKDVKPFELSSNFKINDTVWCAGNTHDLGILFKEAKVVFRGNDQKEDIKLYGPIAPGDSGGPVFTRQGRVIGLTSMVYPQEKLAIGTSAAKILELIKKSELNFFDSNSTTKTFFNGLQSGMSTSQISHSIHNNIMRTYTAIINKDSQNILNYPMELTPKNRPTRSAG